MSKLLDLDECREFRLSLQARPHAAVHGLAVLMAAAVATALIWAAATRVDLVVRGAGRLRPEETPARVFLSGNEAGSSAGPSARVVEVDYHEGDRVHRGDVLIRLDGERLDNDVSKLDRTIRSGEEDLAKLAAMETAQEEQSRASRAKAEAELADGVEDLRQRKEKQAADVRVAELDLRRAEEEEQRLLRLLPARAVSQEEASRATAAARQAAELLEKAKLPVNEGGVEVLRRALDLAGKEEVLKRQDLQLKQSLRQAEVEAARLERANLELERKQTVLCAPTEGVVTSPEVKVGDVLERGRPVVEIAEQEGFRFEAAVSSEEVGHLRTGMPARVKLDAYDYQKYGALEGEVVFISPDSETAGPSGAEHPASYLVRIALKEDEVGSGALRAKVKLGMTGRVEIITERESLLWLLFKQVRRSISLG